ncbi:hypothetical protein [Microbacterium sp.]|uniref:hypothetical protein n=1 Tax=Microbacterium sp. TaxID=51671 RepID=UPI0039E6FF11
MTTATKGSSSAPKTSGPRAVDAKIAEVRARLKKGAVVEPLCDLVGADNVGAVWGH